MSLYMKPLYDDDKFTVVGVQYDLPADEFGMGYEIVDKPAARMTYLSGPAADVFLEQTRLWEEEHPYTEEVHELLAKCIAMCSVPLHLH